MHEQFKVAAHTYAKLAMRRAEKFQLALGTRPGEVTDLLVIMSPSGDITMARVFMAGLDPVDVTPPREEKGETIARKSEYDRKNTPFFDMLYLLYNVVRYADGNTELVLCDEFE